ncbi:MAG: type II toxin-antitoxin system VapC family toxin [Dehalococcoidia bacterium]
MVDSSAVLTLVQNEPGAAEAASVVAAGALISSVNFSEVVAKLADRGIPEREIRARLARLVLQIVAFDTDQALRAGMLRPVTREAGLSLGDRACLALAQGRNLPVVTADRTWQSLTISVEIRLIR